MAEQKRFQNQQLSSKDYKKKEEGAKLFKNAAKILPTLAVAISAIVKYGPKAAESIKRLRKD